MSAPSALQAPGRGRSHAPLLVALAVLAVAVGGSVKIALSLTGGHLVYALDDAYIHMAMGRTLAESGVWGIAPAHPAFASSSPGWTLLLAAVDRAGLHSEWVPLGLNAIAAIVLLFVADRVARRLLTTDAARLWLLLAVVLVTPMPALVLGGMESLWQVTAVVAFVAAATRVAPVGEGPLRRFDVLSTAALAPVMVSLRYESLFVAGGAVLVLAWRRRGAVAASVLATALVPVLAYAVYADGHGGFWLPSSVMMKAQPPSLGDLPSMVTFMASKGFLRLSVHGPLPSILVSMLLALMALAWRNGLRAGETEAWLLIGVFALLAHVHLVGIEWLFRYRAYVVATGVMAIAFGLSRAATLLADELRPARDSRGSRFVAMLLAASLGGPLVGYAIEALPAGPRGSLSTYLQHYQVARFLATQGRGPVALNDIGAVAYFTRRPIVDLAGLGDQRIAVARRSRAFDTAGIDAATRQAGASVAVIYEAWFEGPLAPPGSWVRVGRWTSAEHSTTAEATVSFFATRADEAEPLRNALHAWTPRLPPGVTVQMDEPVRTAQP